MNWVESNIGHVSCFTGRVEPQRSEDRNKYLEDDLCARQFMILALRYLLIRLIHQQTFPFLVPIVRLGENKKLGRRKKRKRTDE